MVKLIQMRVRAGPNGDAVVPLGAEAAGQMVDVTITPAPTADLINGLTREEWFKIFERSEGSIDDPSFCRPPQEIYENRSDFD